MQIDYSELVQEVAEDVRRGRDAVLSIIEIADDAGASRVVLQSRFARAYPDGVPAALPSVAELVERRVAALCEKNGIPRDRTLGPIRSTTGRNVIIVCRTSGGWLQVVDTENAASLQIHHTAFTAAAVQFSRAA